METMSAVSPSRGRVSTITRAEVDMSVASIDFTKMLEVKLDKKPRQSMETLRYGHIRSKIPGMTENVSPRLQETKEEAHRSHFLNELRLFVRQHFHRKECTMFIPVPNQKVPKVKYLKCFCGGILQNHQGMRNQAHSSGIIEKFIIPKELQRYVNHRKLDEKPSDRIPQLQWQPSAIQKTVTNTYGKVNFTNVEHIGGKKPAKYIRMTDDDSVDDLLDLMVNYWRIQEPQAPNLVISVVGGAKNFKLDGRMRDTFSTGLIKAAKTTSAWMITSGFNMGVMKAVGQAVHQGQSFCWDNDRMAHVLRCIGIAPWGYIEKRHELESSDGMGLFNADFIASKAIRHGEPCPLNPDHTHFVFVDDGYRNRYGGVAAVRAKLEQKISQPESAGGLGIPVVLVVVEGGTDAIYDAKKSLEHRIPVVVCSGTGRAADILAYAYGHTMTTSGGIREMREKNLLKLKDKIFDAYGKAWKEEEIDKKTDTIADAVKFCCQNADLMIIFNMNKHEDLDLAILKVLLKSYSGDDEDQRIRQLKLALMWDREGLAQEEIFREDVLWGQGSLNEVLMEAILTDKLKFIDLILQQGSVSMKEFLTVERLQEFYLKIPPHHFIYSILFKLTGRNELTMKNVYLMLCRLLDRYEVTTDSQVEGMVDELDTEPYKEVRLMQPYKHLMVWAVLQNRQSLAKYCWELGDEPVTSGIVVTRLYDALARNVSRHESIIRDSILENKLEFEMLATHVLDECHQSDPVKAQMIVERTSTLWNEMTCTQIAAASSDRKFLSSEACYDSIMTTWKQGIVASYKKIFLAVMFPPVILFALEISNIGSAKMKWWEKLGAFYSSPVVKYAQGTLMYIGFMLTFSYMILVDFRQDRVTPLELICVLWVFAFSIDKLHVFLAFPAPTFASKLRDWYGIVNWVEVLNYLMCFLGLLFHYLGSPSVTKVMYCLNSVIFFMSITKTYTASSSMGPKLVMILNMMGQLRMFIMILLVFLLAYGVASQGLLYDSRSSDWVVLKDIFYFPYWQLYGEIWLEELETDDCVAGTEDCRTFHWMVPFLLAMYLLVGNILLLNLLIAIFTYEFQQVDANSIEIWKYQMYFLVVEHDKKTMLAPPFSLLAHITILGRWVFHKLCCKPSRGVQTYGKRHLEYLHLFEKEMMTNYLRNQRLMEMSSLETTVSKLEKRVDDLTKLIEDEVIADQHVDTKQFGTLILRRDDQMTKDLGKPSQVEWPPLEDVIAVREQVIRSEIPSEYFTRQQPKTSLETVAEVLKEDTAKESEPKTDNPNQAWTSEVARDDVQKVVTGNEEGGVKDAAPADKDGVASESLATDKIEDEKEHKKKHKEKKKRKKHKSKERKRKREHEVEQNNVNQPLSLGISNRAFEVNESFENNEEIQEKGGMSDGSIPEFKYVNEADINQTNHASQQHGRQLTNLGFVNDDEKAERGVTPVGNVVQPVGRKEEKEPLRRVMSDLTDIVYSDVELLEEDLSPRRKRYSKTVEYSGSDSSEQDVGILRQRIATKKKKKKKKRMPKPVTQFSDSN